MESRFDDDMLDKLCLVLSVIGFERKELRARYFALSKGGSQPRNASLLTDDVLTISILWKRQELLRERNQDDARILAAIFCLPPDVHIIRVDSAQWRMLQIAGKWIADDWKRIVYASRRGEHFPKSMARTKQKKSTDTVRKIRTELIREFASFESG